MAKRKLSSIAPSVPIAPADAESHGGSPTESHGGSTRTTWQWFVSLILHVAVLAILAIISIPTGVGSNSLDVFAEMAESEPFIPDSVDVVFDLDASTPIDQLPEESTEPPVAEPLDPSTLVVLDSRMVDPKDVKPKEELSNIESMEPPTEPSTPQPRDSNPVGKKKENAIRSVSSVNGVIETIGKDIAASLKGNRTLVVWLFDRSPSLITQRAQILEQLTKVYSGMGGLSLENKVAFADHSKKALLTQVAVFGQDYEQALTTPVSTFEPVERSIRRIVRDDSGIENVMRGVQKVVSKYRGLSRLDRDKGIRKCNVVIVVITDEAGDDIDQVEETIEACQRAKMPVYVIGVPAPFGEQESIVKWTDPDIPNAPTVPAVVTQGPESLVYERVASSCRLEPLEDTYAARRALFPPPVDSGFGPYALTMLSRETGGIFFAVHPNREGSPQGWGSVANFASHLTKFYSPDVMKDYGPDYLPAKDFFDLVDQQPIRRATIDAAKRSTSGELILRTKRFFGKDRFNRQIAAAQREAEDYAKRLSNVYDDLKSVESQLDYEASKRWRANYMLAMANVEGSLARLYSWMALLEMLDSRQPSFDMHDQSRTNNFWIISESNELLKDERVYSMVAAVKNRCKKIIEQHAGTPWATAAQWEMNVPFGFQASQYYQPPTPKTPGPRTPTPTQNQPRRL